MRSLWNTRLSPFALAVLACVAGLASVVIIHSGLGRTPAQAAAIAALAHRKELLADAGRTAGASVAGASTAGASRHAGGASSAAGGSGDGGGGSGAAGDSSGDSGSAASDGSSTTTSSTSTTSTTSKHSSSSTDTDAGLPKIGHVFLIVLSTPSYDDVFGENSQAPYLRSLMSKGVLLSGFRSLGHGELADELAMVSGQAPNRDTSEGCPTYNDFPSSADTNRAGDVRGTGCVYPDSVLTIGDQVTSDGKTWGAYIADMGATSCQHPNSDAATDVALAGTDAGYDLQHNPFVFFDSLLDAGGCQANDLDLTKLSAALATRSSTPVFSYVGADACADGDPVSAPSGTSSSTTTTTTDTTTTSSSTTTTGTNSTETTGTSTSAYGCPAGAQSGIAAEDAFLKQWVPAITGSAAYRKNGVLVIAFAGSASSPHPVRTGALVLSRYKAKHKQIDRAYDPYSLLRSLEDMLDQTPLAHAARASAFAKAAL